MKHLFLTCAFLLSIHALNAQGISIINSFGQNGRLSTKALAAYNLLGTTLDHTPNNHLVIVSNHNTTQDQLFWEYASNGDLVHGYPSPQAGIFYQPSAIKSLDNGNFLIATSQPDGAMYRYLAGGSVDPNFGVNGKVTLPQMYPNHLIVSNISQRIFVVGEGRTYPSNSGGYVVAYTLDGQLDTDFGNNGIFYYGHYNQEYFNNAVEQPDGKLLVAGCYMEGNNAHNLILRLLPNGQFDSGFGNNGAVAESNYDGGENYKVSLQTDGKILITGEDSNPYVGLVARYLPNGVRDASFGANGWVTLPMIHGAFDVLPLPSGKILVYGASAHIALAQLLPDGNLDPFFGTGGSFLVSPGADNLPFRMQLLDGNKLIVSSSQYDPLVGDYRVQLYGLLLDLNVGTVSPEEKPVWWTYPNPVSDALEVQFSLESSADLRFELFDLQGKHLQTVLEKTNFSPGAHTQAIQMPGLPAGTYLLSLMGEDKVLTTVRLSKM